MNELGSCPKCQGIYPYQDGNVIICPECAHEWTTHEADLAKVEKEMLGKVFDSNKNELSDGDSISVIQELKYGGSSGVIKQGTVIKNIKLITENVVDDHNIACKIDGVGSINLKSEFVKKL